MKHNTEGGRLIRLPATEEKTVVLTVFERLVLLNVLPAEGDLTTLRIVRKLREGLSFTEEEHAALDLKQVDGNVTWKQEADIAQEREIGPKAAEIVRNRLSELSKQGKLTEAHIDLCDKFGVED